MAVMGIALIAGAVWFGPGRRASLWRRLPAPWLRAEMDLADKYQREFAALGAWRRGYAEAVDTVVYEEGPAATSGRWATSAGRMLQLPHDLRPDRAVRVRLPRPPPLTEAAGHYPFPDSTGVLLLGQLRAPGGAEVPVVVLRSPPLVLPNRPWPTPRGGVEEVGGSSATTPVTSTPYHIYSQCYLPPMSPAQVLRLYAAQRDPADLSHFTVDYELDGRKGVMDGWLRDDLKIHFRLRDGSPGSDAAKAAEQPSAEELIRRYRGGRRD